MLRPTKLRTRNSHSMVNQVNRLIYNTIVSDKSIFLPDVGTITLRRLPAKIESNRVILPPTYRAEFSSQQQGISLVDIIAHAANIDTTEALGIYGRWLDKVRNGSSISIEGVGELRNKSFVADSALLAILNNGTPLTTKRKSNRKWGISMLILVVIIAIVACLYMYMTGRNTNEQEIAPTMAIESTEALDNTADTFNNEPISEEQESTDVAVADVDIQPNTDRVDDNIVSDESGLWSTNSDIRHWVVVGTYSTEANATIAVENIGNTEYEFQIYQLGSMYAVVIFGSSDYDECSRFKRSISSQFGQAWIHTPRRYR